MVRLLLLLCLPAVVEYKYGGLGPSYVGTEQWLQQKQRIEKINEFSKKIRVMN